MKLNTTDITRIALMTAVLCILGPISFPLSFSEVPISLGILGIFLCLVILGQRNGTICIILYILIGMIGIPVFAGFSSGVGIVMGPSGGYIAGYIPLGIIAGFFIDKYSGKPYLQALGMALGTAVCYLLGTLWLAKTTGLGFGAALLAGVIPFIPFDAVKLVIALAVGKPINKALAKISK